MDAARGERRRGAHRGNRGRRHRRRDRHRRRRDAPRPRGPGRPWCLSSSATRPPNKFELVPATTVEETSDDWYFHGTHVSGIVAGDDDGNGITGIAPDAKIMPIHTFPRRDWHRRRSSSGSWSPSRIDYSVAQGADVINMSLGGQSSGIVPTDDSCEVPRGDRDAVRRRRQREGSRHCRRGFGRQQRRLGQPRECPGLLRRHRSRWLRCRRPSTAPTGRPLTLPSTSLLPVKTSCPPTPLSRTISSTPHVFASGTSMASPVVAGVAALVDGAAPRLDARPGPGQDHRRPPRTWAYQGVTRTTGGASSTRPTLSAPSHRRPKPQNFFATWYEPSWGGKNGEAVVSLDDARRPTRSPATPSRSTPTPRRRPTTSTGNSAGRRPAAAGCLVHRHRAHDIR